MMAQRLPAQNHVPATAASAGAPDSLSFISVLFLALPVFLFAFGWLRFPYSVLQAALLAAVLIGLGRRTWRNRIRPSALQRKGVFISSIIAAVLLLTWLALSGVGGFGYQNADYAASNALLKDLILQPWPVQLDPAGGAPLVYYTGYYLPAAVIGKLAGWGAANFFLFGWTYAGLLLAFAWFRRIARLPGGQTSGWGVLPLALVFCLAGGLDLVPALLRYGTSLSLSGHYEIWAPFMQYSSQTALLFWVPQHAVAGWLAGGLAAIALLEPRTWPYLGPGLACTVLWSPFSLVGVLPFLLLAGLGLLRKNAWRLALNRDVLLPNLAALAIDAPLLLYLGANRFRFPLGFAWHHFDPGLYWRLLPVFLLLEFGVFALLILLIQRRDKTAADRWPWGLFAAALLALGLLPLLCMGLQNDLVMRGSIPALLVLWALAGGMLLQQKTWKGTRTLAAAALLVLLLGFFPAATEIQRSLANYQSGPPDLAAVQASATANPTAIVEQRIGDPGAEFFLLMVKQ